ncbi:relaxase/mobilization nuclease domain-containing protein [Qipengyuania sp. 1XM1-15A]|uniref:relaxase/mobilization nuclease domain-containing protein n=1 Tax=Qipengyuania xiamenensis TaxID=2867237 RepID=UPI001C882050|nr:relaxase/mobilization nuclease domain-containing protein [Qipengyuania xiamenensis]MBX7532936.1 relaxase/mobilization nuclease domain-containing protein [Qipengyuania xiamenensis]
MIANPTWGANFAGLVDYLTENRDHQVLHFEGVSSVENAAAEMEAAASLNSRAKNKLLHLSLSAAHEDGQLSDDKWLYIVSQQQEALGLDGHAFVVVRHEDTEHDHVHVFWSTISPRTGKTPPKMWFLKKGCATENIGPQALTTEQVARVPEAYRALRSFDFRALARVQDVCRRVERELDLRRLNTPQEAKAQRLKALEREAEPGQRKRAERTGSVPLMERSEEIREALDQRVWQSRSDALAAIGLQLEPVYTGTKTKRLRGLTIADISDPGNKLKASALDTGVQKFGLGSLDKRILKGTPDFKTWWPERKMSSSFEPLQTPDARSELKQDYDLEVAQHKLDQEERRRELADLRIRQTRELRAKRRALMKQRKNEAIRLKPSERRAFYSRFSQQVRKRELAELEARHRVERSPLRRRRMPTWHQFIAARADAGCQKAGAVLAAMRPVQTVKKTVTATGPKKRLSVPNKEHSKDQHLANQPTTRIPKSKSFLSGRNQGNTEMPEHLAAYWQRHKGGQGRS